MQLIKILPVLILFLVSCEQDVQVPERPELDGKTAIRIRNTSGFFYSNVVVNTNGGQNEYNTIIPSTLSDYKLFDFAYRYAFVEMTIDGELATIQPIDFFGETILPSGYYTYEIGASESSNRYGRLTLILVED